MECTKIILYLVIQRPLRQLLYFTGTHIYLNTSVMGQTFEFVPTGHKVLWLWKGKQKTKNNIMVWLVFILYNYCPIRCIQAAIKTPTLKAKAFPKKYNKEHRQGNGFSVPCLWTRALACLTQDWNHASSSLYSPCPDSWAPQLALGAGLVRGKGLWRGFTAEELE